MHKFHTCYLYDLFSELTNSILNGPHLTVTHLKLEMHTFFFVDNLVGINHKNDDVYLLVIHEKSSSMT